MFRMMVAVPYAVLCLASSASADVVTDWNDAARDAIRIGRVSPPVASRVFAILHASIYDAVNGIDRLYRPYRIERHAPRSASQEAAAASAAHHVLALVFPAQLDAFDRLREAHLSAVQEGSHKALGVEWGEYVAARMLEERATDGADSTMPIPSGSGAGAWVPTPPASMPYLLPHWGFVTPFGLRSGDQFRPDGPPDLTRVEYAVELNEVRALGAMAGSSRTPEQTEIAQFWADGAGTETPPGHWNRIAKEVAVAAGVSLSENARLFALLNLAMADAAIAAWDAKYAYNFWRPITAIRMAATDGNESTEADPAWTPLLVTPPFPDYVSGHSTFSAAAAVVLAAFFGGDELLFTTESDGTPAVQRTFTSFSAAAAEAAISRIFGGIHFRSASEDGLAIGVQIGVWIANRMLVPLKDEREGDEPSPGSARCVEGARCRRTGADATRRSLPDHRPVPSARR